MAWPKTIIIDFDETIAKTQFPYIIEPMPGVKESLTRLKHLGFIIVISSCRTCQWYGEIFGVHEGPIMSRDVVQDMIKFLNDNKIPYDIIDDGTKGKPFGDYYIDDKAIEFKNNWPEIADRIEKECTKS